MNDALEALGAISGIDFPHRDERQSPNKRIKTPSHEVKRLFSQLFHLNRDILERQIQKFLEYLDIYEDQEEKLDFLLTKLTIATRDYLASRPKPTPTSRHNGTELNQERAPDPPSPTLSIMSIKHKRKLNADEIGEIQLPQPASQAAITSNNTSFATIFSEAQKGSQDPPSPATTIEESFHSTQDYGSSLSETTMTTFQSKLAAAQHSASTSIKGSLWLDRPNEYGTQESYYGSPPRSSAFDILESALRAPKEIAAVQPAAERSEASISKPTHIVPENHRVAKIPSDGLTDIYLPKSFYDLPFILRHECVYIAQTYKLDLWTLDNQWQRPRDFKSLYTLASELSPTFRRPFETPDETYSLCVKMRWTEAKDGPLLPAMLLPLQKQLLTAFRQKFGNDRFLFVEADPLSKPPKCLDLSGQADHIDERFLEMLNKPLQWLGRTWALILGQHKKLRKRARNAESARVGAMQYILVALSGDNLPTLYRHTVVGWALKFEANASEPWSKMYARLDLSASRTRATLQLKPDEIEFVDNTYATEDPANTEFNDPELEFHEDFHRDTVMNDGCSEAHEWVLQVIAEAFDKDDISAAQIRCAGAKGMIFKRRPHYDVEDNTEDGFEARPRGPLLQITKSQSKVKLKSEDLDPEQYDPQTLSLNVVKVSHALYPYSLYSDFLPIIVDRHVPAEAIERYAELQAERDFVKPVLKALEDGRALRAWLNQQNSAREDLRRDIGEIRTLAGFPHAKAERAIRMLENGFEATKFKPFEKLMRSIMEEYFQRQSEAYKIQVFQSTMALGIADRTGSLRPGEIQLNFSSPCKDPTSGKRWPRHLSGPVLVSRNPSARPSDMQKVRAVYKPELAHLFDVVIFSARGPRPLADKCSGGDYDGDTFWMCWEHSLVKHFKNAPPPVSLPDPSSLGIEVDERTLSEIVSDPQSEAQVQKFIMMGTANRLKPSLLGIVTKTLERLVYVEGLHSLKAKVLADLKDLLMDSDKNGRSFTIEAWNKLKKDLQIGSLSDPVYFMTPNDDGEHKPAAPKREHILDNVQCIILPRVIATARRQVDAKLANAKWQDKDLWKRYEQTLANAPSDSIIRTELSSLDRKLAQVYTLWLQHMAVHAGAKPSNKLLEWNRAVVACRESFDAIEPDNPGHDTVVEWLRPRGTNVPTRWTLIKASALARSYHDKKMSMSIAGAELCTLKVRESGPIIEMQEGNYFDLGLRKRKRSSEVSEDELDDADDDPEKDLDDDVDMGGREGRVLFLKSESANATAKTRNEFCSGIR